MRNIKMIIQYDGSNFKGFQRLKDNDNTIQGKIEDVLSKIKALNKMAEERGQTLAEMALAWVLKDDLVTSVIIGASSVAQLEDNLKAIRNTSFTKEELRRL